MKKKKLILFDWGNVIQNGVSKNKYNIDDARKKVCNDMKPLKYNELLEMFCLDEFWSLNGERLEEFLVKKLSKVGSHCNFEDFKKSYLQNNENVPYFDETIKLINYLLDNGYLVGLLSNISEFDVIQLKDHLDLNKFSYLFLSCYLGVQKPINDIYNIVECKTEIKAENILFIDDREDNIKVAKKRGWNTCLASGNEIEKIKNSILVFLKDSIQKL